jgi:hypothetical protein
LKRPWGAYCLDAYRTAVSLRLDDAQAAEDGLDYLIPFRASTAGSITISRSAYLHCHVTASGSAMGRLPFWGVLHCAPLP